MSEEEKFPVYEEDSGEYVEKVPSLPESEDPSVDININPEYGSTIEPELIEDEEARKKKRRRRVLIGVFAIALPILIVIGVGIFVVLSIIGAFESCAINCCDSCSENCANSCADSCSDSCTCSCGSCGSSIKISIRETIEYQINNLKWLFYTIFKL